eukprot:m.49679 g.49679  ORF g.49679 m.49679 type:complete len:51 (-) comp13362_c0_seq5:2-154(-)
MHVKKWRGHARQKSGGAVHDKETIKNKPELLMMVVALFLCSKLKPINHQV